jgi:chemotaxis-related protein WspB
VLFLLFRLGTDRYAIQATHVSEVLPLITIKTLPRAPPGVAGVINLRGAPVPIIDLSAVALGRPAPARLSTRIVIVRYCAPNGCAPSGVPRSLGLIAEQVTETMRCEPSAFVAAGIATPAALWLGPVAPDPRGLIQRVDVAQIVPPSIRDLLFRALEDAG